MFLVVSLLRVVFLLPVANFLLGILHLVPYVFVEQSLMNH